MARDRLARRDAHGPGRRAINTRDTSSELIGAALHGARRVGQTKRCLGGYQPATGAIEKNDAKLRLQFCHMWADGGLARVQLACGGKKTALLDDGKESAHERAWASRPSRAGRARAAGWSLCCALDALRPCLAAGRREGADGSAFPACTGAYGRQRSVARCCVGHTSAPPP
jgi:hypothetical protein